MNLKSIVPYTEEVNWTYDSFSIWRYRTRIEKSRAVFSGWSSLLAENRQNTFPGLQSCSDRIPRLNHRIFDGYLLEKSAVLKELYTFR
jgi:succinate-semialdehyde dehydrogenase/glutarate-semialdehyde dehydrogenase